jgi:predicted alpha-1,2-mannosidase
MTKTILLAFLLWHACVLPVLGEEDRYSDYVNPMIGAFGPAGSSLAGRDCGRTLPGPTTPFGLIQLGPDTNTGGDNGNGYSWFNRTIEGFSFTHLSGVGWFGDLGNFLVMPTSGKLKTSKGNELIAGDGYRSRFSHANEIAKVGYYAVTLDDYNIRAELTAAPRAGMLRFTFPKHDHSRIQIDLSRRVGGTSVEQFVKVEDDHTISGWMKCAPEGGGWGNGAKLWYTVHFWCQFSKPIVNFGVWSADIPDEMKRKGEVVPTPSYQKLVADAAVTYGVKEKKGKHLGFFTEFATAEQEVVLVKSGISFVNAEGARQNLEQGIPHWDFDQVVQENRHVWNKALSKLDVSGGSESDKVVFYTGLYRTMVDPRNFTDANGNYMGCDQKIRRSDGFTCRTIFSGWDVFRSQFPLQTIINPEVVNDAINSWIEAAEFSGRKSLPKWEILNHNTGVMLGNPGVVALVDAYEKGIRNYDIVKAFEFTQNTVDGNGSGPNGYLSGSISGTLENAYSEWCVGKFADSLGKSELANLYYQKGQSYKNIWNDEVKWFRGRINENQWLEWKGKTVHGQGCAESNPFQQGWFVPHDVPGMKRLMGEGFFLEELTRFFDRSPSNFRWNDYYNHPNEPVHHVPYLFNEAGAPWLTQKWTRKICKSAYGSDVLGLSGNDDVGQMSAWYVLSAIGLHPICPGDNKYQITSPVFNTVTINLDSRYSKGKSFKIVANRNSEANIYIQSLQLNGKPLERFWLKHHEITEGGILEMEMGPLPKLSGGPQRR